MFLLSRFLPFVAPIHTGFVGEGIGFTYREYLVWYILFVIFVPYAMLPLPLKWCVVGGTITASCHLAVITIIKVRRKEVRNPQKRNTNGTIRLIILLYRM